MSTPPKYDAQKFKALIDSALEADQGARFARLLGEELRYCEALKSRPSDPSYIGGAYVGAGAAGKKCGRAIWYDFRWASRKVFSAKSLRIFNAGQLQETRIGAQLRLAFDETLWLRDEEGRQFSKVVDGLIKSKLDGVIELDGIPHVLEIKSAGKNFGDLADDGVRYAKPDHYVQMQLGVWAFDLPRACYVAVEKMTDDLYVEIIDRDDDAIGRSIARVHAITHADAVPPRIPLASPSFYECKLCDHKSVCYGGNVPAPNARACRTCAVFTIREHGTPWCTLSHDRPIKDLSSQHRGCPAHTLMVLE